MIRNDFSGDNADQNHDFDMVLENCDGNGKKAVMAYFFLAIDRKSDERLLRLFDEFFTLEKYANRYLVRKGLKSVDEPLPDSEEEIVNFCRERGVKNIRKYFPGNGYDDFRKNRDRIIKECDAYLAEIDADEDRYERITEAIRTINEGYSWMSDIGNFTQFVWNLVSTAQYEGIYEGTRKKLVRFLVRSTKRDKASLAEMEEVARNMMVIDEKRIAIKKEGTTDTYERTNTRLAALQEEEKPLKKQLKKLIRRDLFERQEENAAEANDCEYEESSTAQRLVDGIGDGISGAIEWVSDGICGPIEWLTDRIIDLT
jgi:hypothetical protein